MSDKRLRDFSSDFVLSSGTVLIDISNSVILVLYYRHQKEFLLPKGRKNVGETLEAAAVRETMEESGYQCQLLEHNLSTQAPSLKPGPWTTEPIAVHQRVTKGIRKIIFWYLAQVDSSRPQVLNTQEEGEDFDVRWIRSDVAAAKMTYEEDREVVDRALAAVAQRALISTPFTMTDWFRERYLNPGIDMTTMGLLCVCLGGSVVYGQPDHSHPHDVEYDRDWDGIGVVERREDIVRIAKYGKADLCKLLRIETEEYPSLTIPDGAGQGRWDVLRFSGRTVQGSKRTIKIWTIDHIQKIAAEQTPSPIGVLSHKVVRFTQREHPLYGPRLFVYQPFKIADKLCVLNDADFLEVTPSKTTSIQTCLALKDLLSKRLFSKNWQTISGASNILQIIPLFYRSSTFTAYYHQKLRVEFTDTFALTNTQSSLGNDTERPSRGIEVKVELGQAPKGYHILCFAPLSIQNLRDDSPANEPLTIIQYPHTSKYDVQEDGKTFRPTRFSSNSVGSYAAIRTSSEYGWEEVYVKKAMTVSAELEAHPIAQQYFPKEALQTVIATDRDCILYKRFDGETLNDIRLRYHLEQENSIHINQDSHRLSEEWFLNISNFAGLRTFLQLI
ncbi:MAG: hypothetical protein M1835_004325 [Candelina submexicana]|nr:MAG: hypothetical protein M1835_004325 [Candelina submexicana]